MHVLSHFLSHFRVYYTLSAVVIYVIFDPFSVWLLLTVYSNILTEGSRIADNGSIPYKTVIRHMILEYTTLFQTTNHIALIVMGTGT